MIEIALEKRTSRVEKLLVELNLAESFDAAARTLNSRSVTLRLAPEVDRSSAMQAAAVTFVVLSTRFARGGVFVEGAENVPNSLPQFPYESLGEVLISLGARLGSHRSRETCLIGSVHSDGATDDFQIVVGRWWAGIAPLGRDANWSAASNLSATLGGAIAAAECFLRMTMPAHRRLTQPEWIPLVAGASPNSAVDDFVLQYLPTRLSIVGLGHLGQAYAWVLSMLPFADRSAVEVELIDFDRVSLSTPSTSVLTTSEHVGQHKTRVVAAWLEQARFRTRIIESPIECGYKRNSKQPRMALVGVDNRDGRIAVAGAQFDLVVDAGIGSRASTYDALCIRTFPALTKPENAWPPDQTYIEKVLQLTAYKKLSAQSKDQCGIVRLAEKSVGVPFVGVVAACLGISQPIRLLHGRGADEILSLQLRALEDIERCENERLGNMMPLEFQAAVSGA